MEEKIEDIEERILFKLLRKIENSTSNEVEIYIASYAKFVECVQLRKIIENDY